MCPDSNGIDVPFQRTIELKAKEIKKVPLGLKINLPEGLCSLLMGKSSAVTKYKVRVTLGLIDVGYTSELQAVIENLSSSNTKLLEGTAVCQLLPLPAKVPILSDKWLDPKSSRGGFGSTGQKFELKNNSQKHKSSHLNLIEISEHANISATSFGVNIGNQSKDISITCFGVDNPLSKKGLDRKLFIPLFINTYRAVACVDSGSDLSLCQVSLFNKLFKDKTHELQVSPYTDIKSYSDHILEILGVVTCQVKFRRSGPTVKLTFAVIQDINPSVPSLLFGNDSLQAILATISYSGTI